MQSTGADKQTGRARLRDWIERGKFTSDRQAAETLGVHPVVLSQWLSGTRRPDLDNAVKIERATGIAVESWLLNEVIDTEAPVPAESGNTRKSRR